MTSDPILDALNPAQREAVSTTDGPLLVIAGAGTGKTRVITHRIAHLIHNKRVPPWRIMATTFTNKAAEEMRRRIDKMLPGFETARLTVGTFHSICVSILRREAPHAGLQPRFTIADESDQKALIKDVLRTLEIADAQTQPGEVLQRIGQAKIRMLSPLDVRRTLASDWGEHAVRAYEVYEERLAQNNAVDFDDLLLKVVRLFQSRPDILAQYQDRWHYYLVDEYQDINAVQFEFVKLLAGRDRNLCVVGDEDQSIYSWRGADIENILGFRDLLEGTNIVRLEQNYRSTETILSAANAVIARNVQRLGKNLWSDRGAGEPIARLRASSEREEAALVVDAILWLRRVLGVPLREIAVFYRVNALSRLFEDFLRRADVPYRIVGGIRFYDRAEIKDLLAYLRLIVNPADGIGLQRIINKPRRGIGDKTVDRMIADAAARGLPLHAHLPQAARDENLPKRARAGVADLLNRLAAWREFAENHPPSEVLDEVLHDTDYEDSLGKPDLIETLTKRENVEELRRALKDFESESPDGSLDDYLEMVSLASAEDEAPEGVDSVSLMTLHSAKGLEFDCVFMTALEEGVFPSGRAVSEAGRNFEEERRLFYVGVTRAKKRLFLCSADARALYGRTQYNPPSTFLMEVPEELIEPIEDVRLRWSRSEFAESTSAMLDEPAPAATLSDPAAEIDESGLFPMGARVRHSKLGEGEIVGARGSGAGRKVAIRFDAGLELELLERYGGLEVVGDLPY